MIHIGGVASHLLPIHDGLSQIPHKAFLGSTHTTCLDVSPETKTGAQDVNTPEKWDEDTKFEKKLFLINLKIEKSDKKYGVVYLILLKPPTL